MADKLKKSLFGYGKTTKAIAKFCQNDEKSAEKNGRENEVWDIYDDKFDEISQDEFGNFLKPISEFDANKSGLEIPSPGFPRAHALVKNARNLISEYDYFKDTKPFKIWISGTNGKTTTTQMTQFLLENFGSVMGGNVGTPLAELDRNAKFWILETSSFTLYYTKFATPNIYALLPITPDHISWHGSFSEYENAKLKPLLTMSSKSVAIVPKKYKSHEFVTSSKARVYFYENSSDLAEISGVDLAKVSFKEPFLEDALMGLCVLKFATSKADAKLLNGFKLDKNRIEEFSDKFGRIWVNDTKATNLDAVKKAVERYAKKRVYLILGGDSKGVSLEPLFEFLASLKPEIFAIGKSSDEIMELSLKFGLKATKSKTLKSAVLAISDKLKVGEIALLSPACASLDQFSSYEERGAKFKEFVGNL